MQGQQTSHALTLIKSSHDIKGISLSPLLIRAGTYWSREGWLQESTVIQIVWQESSHHEQEVRLCT
jgi:hypothetical protein